ncbi:hypothetical protein [Endozoicomonas sp.]
MPISLGYEWLRETYHLRVIPHHMRSYTGGLLGTRASQVQRHNILEVLP